MKKTLALTLICKDELHNLPRLFKSISSCFDCVYITDTGSKDGTVEYLNSNEAKDLVGCEIKVFHFDWCDDFAAARNFNLSEIKEDYWQWLDCDDALDNQGAFLAWKNEAMAMADAWFLPYHYALKEDGSPAVSFIRERVFKTSIGAKFKDFIHEGVDLRECGRISGQVIQSWSIKHHRTAKEGLDGRERNLRILEARKDSLSSRLKFYYGKELFDASRFKEAADVLRSTVGLTDLEHGDRILALQYLVHALNQCKEFVDATMYGLRAIQLEPNRAEYHCLVADAYAGLGQPQNAIPFFAAAKYCQDKAASGTAHEFSYHDAYNLFPRINLASSFFSLGRFEDALEEIKPLIDSNDQAKMIAVECEKAIKATTINQDAAKVSDIVITCPYPNAYPWDEDLYKTKGLGGSETAAVEMSMHLKKLYPDRRVIIFQHRDGVWKSPTGVEYIPAQELHEYFHKYEPSLHIAWRHAARFTLGRSIVWSHDLITPGAEQHQNYYKIMALSEFHKNYLIAMQGVPPEKILVTRNGINPERFANFHPVMKKTAKVLWPNSPDRGLQYAIKIMDKVREDIKDAELHVFYGMENMKKWGLADKAAELEAMMKTRPWIKYHGNVDQKTLAHHFMEADVWLYPASFIETFCITGIESLSARAWPVVREFGALKSTLKEAKERGWGDIIDMDITDHKLVDEFATKVVSAIKERKWKKIEANPQDYSWASVAKEWASMFELT